MISAISRSGEDTTARTLQRWKGVMPVEQQLVIITEKLCDLQTSDDRLGGREDKPPRTGESSGRRGKGMYFFGFF